MNTKEITELLSLKTSKDVEQLYKNAYKIKKDSVGNKVYFRGLIEFSNICSKDCYYCGLRSGNQKLNRYQMSDTEILEAVLAIPREKDFVWDGIDEDDRPLTDQELQSC